MQSKRTSTKSAGSAARAVNRDNSSALRAQTGTQMRAVLFHVIRFGSAD
jgi:hypothetical protein